MKLARRRRLAGLAAIGAIALVGGCGGGSDDGSSTTASGTGGTTAAELSADEFRTQANRICAEAQDRIDDVPDPETPAEIPTAFSALIPIAQERLDRLRALDPPAELQARFDEAVGLGERQITLARQISDRVTGGEDAEAVFGEIEPQLTANEKRSDALAAELGVPECAGDGADDTSTAGTTATEAAETSAGAGGAVEPAAYLGDVQAAAGALSSFGTLLQSVSSPEDLKSKAGQARQRLDEFDAAIAKLDTYTLDDARLEQQRAGLARTGPRVSETLREFTDAAAKGDLAEIQRLVPEIQSAIGAFQKAATDVG